MKNHSTKEDCLDYKRKGHPAKDECCEHNHQNCDYNNYKRTRYFHGMLLTDRDFREEQVYHNEKRRLHNRMLHGWGVVCGLGIKATDPKSCRIVVGPGMALDCHGNEIVVCEDFVVDLKHDLCDCSDKPDKDPCAGLDDQQERSCKYYVAIKYKEVPTNPESVYAPGGGCEEKVCEYSRIREGFCVRLFKTSPCHGVVPRDGLLSDILECRDDERRSDCIQEAIEEFHESFCENPYSCPICCCEDEPYVVLGSIDFLETNCRITSIAQTMISINDGRRYVMTPMFWQHYLGSIFPAISAFIENPFVLSCGLIDNLRRDRERPEEIRQPARFTRIARSAMFYNMKENDAKQVLEREGYAFHQKIEVSPDNLPELLKRVWDAGEMKKGAKVDLITNKKTGKVIFGIPVREIPTAEPADVQEKTRKEGEKKGKQKDV